MISSNSWKLITSYVALAQHFTATLEGFVRMCFYGALKGNPSPIGLGGLFHDSRVKSCLIYANHYIYASNSEAEFAAVQQGFLMAIKLGYKKLVVEGDSELVINTAKKLSHGAK